MMDSMCHQWEYVPSVRGCSLFYNNSNCNIQGCVHCLTSDSRNNIWGGVCCVTSNNLCVLSWWCHSSMQRMGCRSTLLFHELSHGWGGVWCQCLWLSCRPQVKAADYSALQSFSAWHLWFLGAYVKGLWDLQMYKCTNLQMCQASNSGQLRTSEITIFKTAKLPKYCDSSCCVCNVCTEGNGWTILCTCIKCVLFVFKNMSKSLKSARLWNMVHSFI
jgi:hypothetical protein